MNELYLIIPEKPSDVLAKMINATTEGWNSIIIKDERNIPDLRNKKIVLQ